jgi:3'-5' exoribonuclease
LIIGKIRRVNPSEVDPDHFQRLSSAKIDQMTVRVAEMLRGIKDIGLLNLAEVFLMDQTFMKRFSDAPAGIKNHHAYRGGLLEHTLNLMEVVLRIAPRYPEINADLLLLGAFLHDIGKTEELEYEQGYAYGDEGQLIGHLVMGVEMIDQKVVEAEKLGGEKIDPELVIRIKHMILSHHGEYEFGSPKLPMTLEATALAFLDNLDSKIASFSQQINDCPNNESSWTAYNPNIQRKLFKGAVE